MIAISIPAAVALIACSLLSASPAGAADGQILITQAKALAGNVTPGDAAGFPVTLSLAGSYTLATNLAPGPGLDGIVVAAPDVSIDLNGFRMSGGPAGGANNAGNGIVDKGDRLTVKNGTIGAFKLDAISAPFRLYLIIENMRIINSGFGISNQGGSFARIQNSTVASNIHTGIICGASCHVEGSVVSSNGGYGIAVNSNGTVLGNTIVSNSSYGLEGSSFATTNVVGYGNNTIINNHGGGVQVDGPYLRKLFPNVCSPVAC